MRIVGDALKGFHPCNGEKLVLHLMLFWHSNKTSTEKTKLFSNVEKAQSYVWKYKIYLVSVIDRHPSYPFKNYQNVKKQWNMIHSKKRSVNRIRLARNTDDKVVHRDISYFNISRIQEAGISVLSWRDTECIKWSKSVFQKLKLQWNEEMH